MGDLGSDQALFFKDFLKCGKQEFEFTLSVSVTQLLNTVSAHELWWSLTYTA